MKSAAAVIVILLGLSLGANAGGRMVPVDAQGRVLRITEEMNRTLQLADSLGPRGSVHLYQLDDSSHALVIWRHRNNRLSRTARPIGKAELAEVRTSISQYLSEADPKYPLDRSGRSHFMSGLILLGAGYYSWAIPEARRALRDDPGDRRGRDIVYGFNVAAAVSQTILATGFATGAALLVTEIAPMPEGAARLGMWGGTRGILAGQLFYEAFQRPQYLEWVGGGWYYGWHNSDVHLAPVRPDNFKEHATPLLMSLSGVAAGLTVGYATNLTAGEAAIIGICGDAGFVGGGLGTVSRRASGRFDFDRPGDTRTALLGGVTGLAAGAVLSQLQSYSVGDALLVRESALLGTLLPLGVASAAGYDTRTSGPLALGGLIAGIAAGHYLTRDWDYTTTDGMMAGVALAAGGATTLALGTVIYPLCNPGYKLGDNSVLAFSAGATAASVLAWRHLDYHRLPLDHKQSWNFEFQPQLVQGEHEFVPALEVRLEF